jgi:beta-galactosidase
VHDRKGLHAPVTLTAKEGPPQPLSGWKIFSLPLDAAQLGGLKWVDVATKEIPQRSPAFWRGSFSVEKPADTFLDVSTWNFGAVWVNGHCLGRFWDIGPTQTMYLPGAWLHAGKNEVVVLDLVGPRAPTLAGLERPVLDALHPELDFNPKPAAKGKLLLDGVKPVHAASFAAGSDAQEVRFSAPVEGRQFCFEAANAHDGKPVAAIAELELLDPEGRALSHTAWTVAYVSSEEKSFEDGAATNALDGQTANAWVTAWSSAGADYPHQLVIDLGAPVKIAGFRYTPRAGADAKGRIKNYRVFVGDLLVQPKPD